MNQFISNGYHWALEMVVRSFKGVFRCAPLSSTCSIDWTAWATIAAVAALIVAWFAAATSIKSAIRLRNSEWKRAARLERIRNEAEERAKIDRKTAQEAEKIRIRSIQAKCVVDEAYSAISELKALQALLRNNGYEIAEVSREALGVPLRRNVFYTTERIIDQLHGFGDVEQLSILHAVRTWKTIAVFSEGAPAGMPAEFFLQRKVQIDANLEAVIREYNELREKLRPYIEGIAGVSIVSKQEVQGDTKKIEDEIRKHHLFLYKSDGEEYRNPEFHRFSAV
ncbi:hypothetical protein [Stenotrophomonas rhizophila]